MTPINELVNLFLRYVAFGDGYAKDAVRLLAPNESNSVKGVVCGESGVAGVAALMAVAKTYRDDTKSYSLGCVIISPECWRTHCNLGTTFLPSLHRNRGMDTTGNGCPMGFNKDSVVLVVNTEADTDPELYQRILGGNA